MQIVLVFDSLPHFIIIHESENSRENPATEGRIKLNYLCFLHCGKHKIRERENEGIFRTPEGWLEKSAIETEFRRIHFAGVEP